MHGPSVTDTDFLPAARAAGRADAASASAGDAADAPVAHPGVPGAALQARTGGRDVLAGALRAARADTLALIDAWQHALPSLRVPHAATLNPPLWEWGHVAWFADWWIGRNPAWKTGIAADPFVARHPPRRPQADAWYDSSRVAHADRWTLPLPGADAVREDLADQLASTLARLAALPFDAGDDALYFHRLVLHHEDMHHEAALYMAHALALDLGRSQRQPPSLPPPPAPLMLPAGLHRLGSAGGGFAFDNELQGEPAALPGTAIDAQVVRWAEYLPCVQAGAVAAPPHLRRSAGAWQARHGDRWLPLDDTQPACHLTFDEAQAWCRWAGRRLPTEAEWEAAATTLGPSFRWGDVWEWTASPFRPYPGFEPHPYREYSAPWFDGRPVLRGGSFLTQPRMKHPRYRNYFPGHRRDVPAGLRSCALQG